MLTDYIFQTIIVPFTLVFMAMLKDYVRSFRYFTWIQTTRLNDYPHYIRAGDLKSPKAQFSIFRFCEYVWNQIDLKYACRMISVKNVYLAILKQTNFRITPFTLFSINRYKINLIVLILFEMAIINIFVIVYHFLNNSYSYQKLLEACKIWQIESSSLDR